MLSGLWITVPRLKDCLGLSANPHAADTPTRSRIQGTRIQLDVVDGG